MGGNTNVNDKSKETTTEMEHASHVIVGKQIVLQTTE